MLLLIDANSLIHRCYHALPPFTNKKGEPTGALYGVAGILLKIMQDTKPEYCAALFDRPEPTFRKKKFTDYKIHRPKAEDDLVAQIINAHNLFDAFSIRWIESPGYEADDLIGTLAKKFSGKERVRILTGDLDSLQLVKDGRIEVETFKKGISETIVYDEAGVKEKYGLRADQLIDYKALVGDASDNIPGVAGIGPKTAAHILQKYETLDNFFEEGQEEKAYEKISRHKDIAVLSRELGTIYCEVPLNTQLSDLASLYLPEKIFRFFENNNFTSLIKRLEESNTGTEFTSDALKPEHDAISPETRVMLQLLEQNPGKEITKNRLESELKKRGLWNVWENIEKPLIPIIAGMKQAGIRMNRKQLKKTEERLDAEIEKKEKKLRTSLGNINPNSPKQVLEQLNKRFGFKLKSTSAETLAKLKEKPPALQELLEYRELFKLKTTYLHPLSELVGRDGRIHPTFIQIGAATGRIACQNPNLQNIPQESKWSGEIRSAFIAADGYSLVSCDYSQIELRVLAHLTGDQHMMDTFTEGKDIHTRTASFIFGVPDEMVDKSMRRTAKTLNFGMVYGMGYRAFARSANIPSEEAKEFMKKYFEEFSTIKKWQEHVLTEARKNGYIQNESGRIRHFPEIYAANNFFASEAERAAINMPTQSLAADILKLAMIKTDRVFRKKYPDIRMLLTIHDELIFEVPDALLQKGTESPAIQDIKDAMENAYTLSVPLAVSISIGKTWKDLG